MRYSKLLWKHQSPNYPVEIFSEHDANGWESRKVELYRDGTLGFASLTDSSDGTELSLIQCPPDLEVNSDPEFRVVDVTKAEFESVWNKARQVIKSA